MKDSEIISFFKSFADFEGVINPLTAATVITAVGLERFLDKSGHPLFFHASRVSSFGKTTNEKVAGMLHDTVEDNLIMFMDSGEFETEAEIFDCLRVGFGNEVVDAVDAVTRRGGEPYKVFIARVGKNDLAIRVKLNDLRDNTDPTRCAGIQQSLLDRYAWAKEYLLTTIKTQGGTPCTQC